MRKYMVTLGLLLVILALLVSAQATLAAPAGQAEPPDVDLTDLAAVLSWLAGAGASYVVTRLLVFVADILPGWSSLDPMLQNVVKLVLVIGVALGAHWLLQQTALIEQVQPIWQIIVLALAGGWLGERDAVLRLREVRAQEEVLALARYQANAANIAGRAK